MIYSHAKFLLSAARLQQLPHDEGYEVAFVGRSNAGKSSVLNALCKTKGLAKTSKTPGRTQLINLFTLDETRRLVDLPGYGYAKVSVEIKQRWQRTLSQYLETRQCLRGLVLIMDIRHPLREMDCNILAWAKMRDLPVHVLLNKADKLKYGAQQTTLKVVSQQLDSSTFQLFSCKDLIGLPTLYKKLNTWFEI